MSWIVNHTPIRSGPCALVIAAALGASLAACGAAPRVGEPTADLPRLSAPQPTLETADPYVPPSPRLVEHPRLPPIWLLERHDVPLVAIHVVVPYGAASDPAGQGGLAALTAEMMEQGAGRRGALELGQAAERLGAELTVEADRDASSARLVVLSANLEPALALLGDVVARPRFEEAEWARTHPLWLSGLASRAFEPRQVASVVADAALFGPNHPYGHPIDGTVDSAKVIDLAAVKTFHARHWRRDRATVVVAGDVTAEQLGALLPPALLQWGSSGEPPPWPEAPPAPPSTRRIALVERADSAQTVLLMVEPGPAAGEGAIGAGLADIALGGSFTSRLNLNLREDKGYTYGARSSLPFARGIGLSRAGAAVQTAVTGPAMVELRTELTRMAADGLQAAELVKARATARGGDVEAQETVAAVADRLAQLAGLGLPPDHDARVARRRAALSAADVQSELAALPSGAASLVAVGDPKALAAAVEALGPDAPTPIYYDADGRALGAAPGEAAAPAAPVDAPD